MACDVAFVGDSNANEYLGEFSGVNGEPAYVDIESHTVALKPHLAAACGASYADFWVFWRNKLICAPCRNLRNAEITCDFRPCRAKN